MITMYAGEKLPRWCPKCNCTDPWVGPVYVPELKIMHPFIDQAPERLKYTCSLCGYAIFTPTKDATR